MSDAKHTPEPDCIPESIYFLRFKDCGRFVQAWEGDDNQEIITAYTTLEQAETDRKRVTDGMGMPCEIVKVK